MLLILINSEYILLLLSVNIYLEIKKSITFKKMFKKYLFKIVTIKSIKQYNFQFGAESSESVIVKYQIHTVKWILHILLYISIIFYYLYSI